MIDALPLHFPCAPPPSPVRGGTRRTLIPEVKINTQADDSEVVITVIASPPTAHHSADLSATCSFDMHGDLAIEGMVSLRPLFQEYVCHRATQVFAEPSRHAAIGMLPGGSVVHGGLPSSEGWIPLDDDESWILESPQIRSVRRQEAVRAPFTRHVPLPRDIEMKCATCQEMRGGLVVTLPRRHMQPGHEKVTHVKAPPPPSPKSVASPTPPFAAPSLSRTYSRASEAVLETLDGINERLTSIQAACDAADSALDAPSSLERGLRSQLASLHGDANTLLAAKIDAILISDLSSGKEHVRMRRKALAKQAERLIERIEAQVRRFDEIRATSVEGADDAKDDISMF